METLNIRVHQIPDNPPESLDQLVCSDIISKFSYDQMQKAILSWWSILRRDGLLEIRTSEYPPNNFTEMLVDMGFTGTEVIFDGRIANIKCKKADWYTNARLSWNIHVNPTETLLEVGPGNYPCGFATQYLDISDDFKRDLKGVPLDIGNVEKMSYGDKQFDIALASHVLEHTDNPDVAMKELQRVAKRGVIECPSAAKDWILQEAHVHRKWQVTRVANTLVFTALSPDQMLHLEDEKARNYLYRVTQNPGIDNFTGFVLRRLFWTSNEFLNPIVMWDETHVAECVVVRDD